MMNENKYSKLSEEIINLLISKLSISDYMKVTKEISDLEMEIKRLKEDYMILQNASDEVEEEKDKEIERLTAESTKWESKFYDEAKKVDRAIEYINNLSNEPNIFGHYGIDSRCKNWLLNILKGSDKE